MLRPQLRGLPLVLIFGLAAPALAQQPPQAQAPPEHRWSADFGIGWDKGISGNINSGAIGVLNGQTVVILKNKYEDVYGTGLHIQFGGGYMYRENCEIRLSFTFQSLDADLVRMGDMGVSNLYGQYDDYQSFGMEVGWRRYAAVNSSIRAYAEGNIGLAFVDETDVTLAAPQINFQGTATDFYDRTAAFSLGVNAGLLFPASPKVDGYVQLGVRYVTGMSPVDAFVGTGLEHINDKSGRWAIPLTAGVRVRF
jgi:hypothetical protein